MQASRKNQHLGESTWAKMPKVNAELFSLTYGAMIAQLVKDLEDVTVINDKLEKMGHGIGIRIIDEFLAKTGISNCKSFKDTAEMIAKVAFKMFLGVTAEVSAMSADGNAFSLILNDNPLAEFVELPPQYSNLQYSNILVGVLQGALEMVQLQVEARFLKDVLRGDDCNEIRVELKGVMSNAMSEEYKEN